MSRFPNSRRGRPFPNSLPNPARIYEPPTSKACLDSTQLTRLEDEFRRWAASSNRHDTKLSRQRVLLIFLIIRYTAAKLNEVLDLDLNSDVLAESSSLVFGKDRTGDDELRREVRISNELLQMVIEFGMADSSIASVRSLRVDEGHVRRKFYARAEACGFSREPASPNAIRKARAVELLQNNVPMPVVQRILGHSSPNLTAAFVQLSREDMDHVANHYMEKESSRKTSARNSFFGKISCITKGDIQAEVKLTSHSGDSISTVITNTSLRRLGLKVGSLVTAEVKAPWVILEKALLKPNSSAENIFYGTITSIKRGKLTSEIILELPNGTTLCSLMTVESARRLKLKIGDNAWAVFNSFAVIIHVD